MSEFVKRRGQPEPGSIPAALDMFRSEVRFYREIAPVAGVRVPACFGAYEDADGTLLVLEDLSAWSPGADPVVAAGVLAGLHERWERRAPERWPWLRQPGAAANLVEDLYDQVWPVLAAGYSLPAGVADLGARLAGKVVQADLAVAGAGPATLVHGDASTANMRTGPGAEVALLDWEDVSAAPGVLDLAWMLVSSVPPARWLEVIAAYGRNNDNGLAEVLPAAIIQGLLSLADTEAGSPEADAWIARLAEASRLLNGS